jgi:transcriptional regulator with XRE-family HTH domain
MAHMEVQSVREMAAVMKALRRQKGWSQATLAREAGVGREWIIHLEKARPTVELGRVMGTLKALGVRLRIEPQTPQGTPEIDLKRMLDGSNPSDKR